VGVVARLNLAQTPIGWFAWRRSAAAALRPGTVPPRAGASNVALSVMEGGGGRARAFGGDALARRQA
jgi:hypothetical protein